MMKQLMKSLLTILVLITAMSAAQAAEVNCRGEHSIKSTAFGGKIIGRCNANQENLNISLEYKIATTGFGLGASSHAERELSLNLDEALLEKLKERKVLDLEVCSGGSVEIGYLAGVNFSRVCARESDGAQSGACLTFFNALRFSGVGVELGAECEKFHLELN